MMAQPPIDPMLNSCGFTAVAEDVLPVGSALLVSDLGAVRAL